MNDMNPKGVINVYWSAFENSGNVSDFLKYKTAQSGSQVGGLQIEGLQVEGANSIATNQKPGTESHETGRPQ